MISIQRKKSNIQAIELEQEIGLYIVGEEAEYFGKPGDYLIIESGKMYIISKDSFIEDFYEVKNSNH